MDHPSDCMLALDVRLPEAAAVVLITVRGLKPAAMVKVVPLLVPHAVVADSVEQAHSAVITDLVAHLVAGPAAARGVVQLERPVAAGEYTHSSYISIIH